MCKIVTLFALCLAVLSGCNLTIECLCSQNNQTQPGSVGITCKTGPDEYKSHFLGLSDNVTYFIEQVDAASANIYHYRVIFKPSAIIPDVDLR